MANPKQCPECGRFLANAFIDGLAEADAPCPKCGVTLNGAMFGAATAAPPRREASVRPPDPGLDVLAGWDHDPTLAGPGRSVALPREVALAVGVVCAGAGFVIARRHPVWGAVLGAASGVVVSSIGRSVYEQRGG